MIGSAVAGAALVPTLLAGSCCFCGCAGASRAGAGILLTTTWALSLAGIFILFIGGKVRLYQHCKGNCVPGCTHCCKLENSPQRDWRGLGKRTINAAGVFGPSSESPSTGASGPRGPEQLRGPGSRASSTCASQSAGVSGTLFPVGNLRASWPGASALPGTGFGTCGAKGWRSATRNGVWDLRCSRGGGPAMIDSRAGRG